MANMKNETAIQRRFTDIISGKQAGPQSQRHEVYGKLLYYRFEEVIHNAFDRLMQYMSDQEWHDLISGFIRHGATSPYIWRLPDEFRKFAAQKTGLPFAADMMWFEWIEIELLMQTPPKTGPKPLKTRRRYALSKTARVKKLAYRVFEKDDDRKFLKAKKTKAYILVYLDPSAERVMYLEITEFMYRLLKSLKQSPSLDAALKTLSKAYGEKSSEVREIILPALENFARLGIII